VEGAANAKVGWELPPEAKRPRDGREELEGNRILGPESVESYLGRTVLLSLPTNWLFKGGAECPGKTSAWGVRGSTTSRRNVLEGKG